MSANPPRRRLLGLAEELADADPHLGDQRAQEALHLVLDRCAHALVDVARGQSTFTRTRSRTSCSGATGGDPSGFEVGTADPGPPDRASCSALAARCWVIADALVPAGEPVDPGQGPAVLARRLADCLREVASGLQRYVQDLADTETASTHQRLHRSLRRAEAHLEPGAP